MAELLAMRDVLLAMGGGAVLGLVLVWITGGFKA